MALPITSPAPRRCNYSPVLLTPVPRAELNVRMKSGEGDGVFIGGWAVTFERRVQETQRWMDVNGGI